MKESTALSYRWRAAQTGLKTQLAPHIYENWIKPLEGVESDDGKIRLIAPSQFHVQWVLANYSQLLRDTLQMEFQFEVGAHPLPQLRVISGGAAPARAHVTAPELEPTHVPTPAIIEPKPSTEVKSDSFIAWDGISIALKSLRLLLDSQGALPFNPLQIKGGAGSGKSTFAREQLARYQADHPDARICYLSIPQFTQELVRSIQKRDVQQFQLQYQTNYDLLVVDDLQFLEGKKKIQEEFLHLLNYFIMKNRPVIVLTQKWSSELPLIESLRQRLQVGLCVEIDELDRASQERILRSFQAKAALKIPEPLFTLLAARPVKTVSDIFTLWTRLSYHHNFVGTWPSEQQLNEWIRPHLRNASPTGVEPEKVLQHISNTFKLTTEKLKGTCRKRSVGDARRILVQMLRDLCQLSTPDIGEILDRHPSTILHLLESNEQRLQQDPLFSRQLQFVKETFQP